MTEETEYINYSHNTGKVIVYDPVTRTFSRLDIIDATGNLKVILSGQDGLKATKTNPIPFTSLFGVPSSFNRMMRVTRNVPIQKGQLNKIYLRPRIPNERIEDASTIQATVDATTIVSQIFKASKDNITGLSITLESATGILLDNFESYLNSTELQAKWIASGSLAALSTTIFEGGAKSMQLPLSTLGDSWEYTILSTDFSEFTGSFNIYQTNATAVLKVYIQDSVGNKKFSNISIVNANDWQKTEVAEAGMTEDPGNSLPTDSTDIVIIGFEVVTLRPGSFAYIDNLTATPPPGDVELKLWDMGKFKPAPGVTPINSGTQYDQLNGSSSSVILPMLGGKRLYHLHDTFSAGAEKDDVNNKLLTIGNYYLLEIKYINTDVSVYGPDFTSGANTYHNGYAATSPDESSPLQEIDPCSDIMFVIQSLQDIYVKKCSWRFDGDPNGNSDIFIFSEDTSSQLTQMILDHEEHPETAKTEDLSDRPVFIEDGGKIEVYYNDDFTDGVSRVDLSMTYFFENPIVNG